MVLRIRYGLTDGDLVYLDVGGLVIKI